jgi:biotin synthase
MFIAGIDAAMVGNYLTTKGRTIREDIQMINDLGLTI